jgi:hypothetical protein
MEFDKIKKIAADAKEGVKGAASDLSDKAKKMANEINVDGIKDKVSHIAEDAQKLTKNIDIEGVKNKADTLAEG